MSDNIIVSPNSDRAKRWAGTGSLFIILGIEVVLLIYDIPIFNIPRRSPNPSPEIAQLMSKKNTVRVQTGGELVWSETENKQLLHRQESILTLERSAAEIAFLDGTGLEIGENSLVLLERNSGEAEGSKNQITVKLLRGTLHKSKVLRETNIPKELNMRATPELNIQVGEIIAKVLPQSELTVKADANVDGKGRVIVQSGEVPLLTPEGAVSLKGGEEAEITTQVSQDPQSKSTFTTRQVTFSLLAPLEGEIFEADSSVLIKFRWHVSVASTGGNPLEFEVSPDSNFLKTVNQIQHLRIGRTDPPLEEVSTQLKLPVRDKPTAWYWRVHTVGDSPIFSSVQKFWVQKKGFVDSPLNAPLSIMKDGYQSIIEPKKAPPPPSIIFTPEIIPMSKIKKARKHR
jgi:hypothetical protein